MSCGCNTELKDGKAVVDRVRFKGKDMDLLETPYTIKCSCGNSFTMKTLVDKCPNCNMTYGVTPCGQGDINNVKAADINN